MFWTLYTNENTKNLRRNMLWIELALLAGLIVLILGLFYAALEMNLGGEAAPAEARAQLQQSLTWPGALLNALSIAGGNALGGLLLVVLAGAVTAQEYTWRTMQLWLSRGVPRWSLVLAKFAGLLLPALMIVMVALVTSGLVSAAIGLKLTGGLPISQVDFVQLGLSLVRTAYTLLPYAGLAFLLAIASRSTVVAVGAGLAYTLLIEAILVQLLGLAGGSLSHLWQYLPAGLANSLMQLNGGVIRMVDVEVNGASQQLQTLPPLQAAIGIALWTLLFVGLALWIFQRQDLSE